MKKSKKEIAQFILKAVTKTRKQILTARTKAYLKPYKKKPWYDLAVKETVEFTLWMEDFLNKQKKEYIKLIKGSKKLFKKTIQKGKYRTEEYLDERYNHVVVDDIQDQLLIMRDQFEKDLQEQMEKMINKKLIPDATQSVMSSFEMDFDFNKFDKFSRYTLRDKEIHWGKQVQDTTEKSIKSVLVDGFEQGLGSFDIAQMIKHHTDFSFGRAENVVRTEVISACNYGDLAAWNQHPDIVGKEWDSSGDKRVRPTHRAADGQKRKLNEPFIVGGSRLMHPGDGSLGAAAKEVCRCRCTMYPIFKGESLKSETVYDDKKVGTKEWIKDQDKGFIEEYLGGKQKRILLLADVLQEEDFQKTLKQLKDSGIITVSKRTLKHSTVGDFSQFLNPNKPEKGGRKLLSGGHSQKNIQEFERLNDKYKKHPKYNKFKINFEYHIKEILSNGVRVGNIPNHDRKIERTGKNHAWFPEKWNDEKIYIAGTYVANLKDKNMFTQKVMPTGVIYKRAEYDEIKVVVVMNQDGEIDTLFPDNNQNK